MHRGTQCEISVKFEGYCNRELSDLVQFLAQGKYPSGVKEELF